MQFLWKKWWLFALAFFATGIVITIVAVLGLGADGSNVYIDNRGIHVVQSGKETGKVIDEKNLETFSNINISTVSADIELIPSDYFGIEAYLPANANEAKWNIDNDWLDINTGSAKSNRLISIFSFNFSLQSNYFVKIYYPEGTEFNEAILGTTSGDIKIFETTIENLSMKTVSGDVNAEIAGIADLSITTTSGDIKLTGNSEIASKISMKTVSGGIEVVDLIWNTLTAETTSGNIRIFGEPNGPANVRTVSGDVRINTSGLEIDYDISTVAGRINVYGQRIGGSIRSDDSSGNLATIRTTSGNITLE